MSEFLHRPCPGCTTQGAPAEMRASQVAETMDIAALRPFWTGLLKQKCFFTYHRCEECSLLYTPVFFTPEQLGSLYSQMAPNMEMVSDEAIIATQRGYFQHAARHAGDGGMSGGYLEIGPDVGHIVYDAATHGRFDHFWLFEPNRAIHGRLRDAARGWPVTLSAGMEDLSAVPDGSVGMAVMVHVLDHLLDPLAMLRQIRAKLRPGGTLMIVTHNEASLLRRVMGEAWPPFCLQHPELYNPATIAALLRQVGFHAVEVERSRNVFPLDFLVRQAAWAVGLKLDRVPLPAVPIGLKLGNMLTLASG